METEGFLKLIDYLTTYQGVILSFQSTVHRCSTIAFKQFSLRGEKHKHVEPFRPV
jgi:hypothetical protein